MRTVQQIIDAAYARSKDAQQGVDADQAGELLPLIEDRLGIFFQLGARVNPEFFATSKEVAPTGSYWQRPSDAEMIYWVEDSSGEEVVRVPRDDQQAEPAALCLYRLGQRYYPVTQVARSPSGTLTFLYAKKPDSLTGLSSTIDPLWPAGHETLLVLEVAMYIALKDRRQEDAQFLQAQRDRQQERFIMHVQHEDIGVRYRTGRVRRFNVGSLVS